MNKLIFVVTHKNEFFIPKLYGYKSIAVGKNEDNILSDLKDNSGFNIAEKNMNYCELTAQYWVWKNLMDKYDFYGLCHYRRYFASSFFKRFKIIDDNKIEKIMKRYDVILPINWYWNKTVKEVYYVVGQGRKKDLDLTRIAILKLFPTYLEDFDYIINSTHSSYCNMFIMNAKNFNNYNSWLFSILQYIEIQVDLTDYTPAEARIFGYLSEILINVWVRHNNLKVKYLPMIEIESSKIGNIKKDIVNFKRKIF